MADSAGFGRRLLSASIEYSLGTLTLADRGAQIRFLVASDDFLISPRIGTKCFSSLLRAFLLEFTLYILYIFNYCIVLVVDLPIRHAPRPILVISERTFIFTYVSKVKFAFQTGNTVLYKLKPNILTPKPIFSL